MLANTLRLALALIALQATQAVAESFPDPFGLEGGSLLVSIWDIEREVSIVYGVPDITYQDLRDGALSSFAGVIPEFSAVFGSSSAADIRFTVTAAGTFSPAFPNPPPALFVTGPDAVPVPTNLNVQRTAINLRTFMTDISGLGCQPGAACVADNFSDPRYPGRFPLGALTAELPFSAAGEIGSALVFWDLAQNGVAVFPGFPALFPGSDPASATDTLGTWLLSADGMLTYRVVPLPAGVWLLLSALGALIPLRARSRRRQTMTR